MSWYDGVIRVEAEEGWRLVRNPAPLIPAVLAVDTHDLTTPARILAFAVLQHSSVLFQLDPCIRTWTLAVAISTRQTIFIRRACMSLAFDICPVVRCCSCGSNVWLDDAGGLWGTSEGLCRCGAAIGAGRRLVRHAECSTCYLQGLRELARGPQQQGFALHTTPLASPAVSDSSDESAPLDPALPGTPLGPSPSSEPEQLTPLGTPPSSP